MQLSIERVVVLLTPFFAGLGAWLSAWIAANFPGLPDPSGDEITALEIAAFLAITAIVGKWLHGRQIPAIAQLKPSDSEQAAIHESVVVYLEEHRAQLQGPPGAPGVKGEMGVTPEQVQGLVKSTVSRILAEAAQQ